MICYLVRHGQDDETVRGGWSAGSLTEKGIRQAESLARNMESLGIAHIYSSDLPRAMETGRILAKGLGLSVEPLPQFREVNNGELAGMKNEIALVRYPGLFWNQLGWETCYPGGESPKLFYERIRDAWEAFSGNLNGDTVLVTHGGVIQVIRTILENRPYSNAERHRKVDYAEAVVLTRERGNWKECKCLHHSGKE